MATMTMTEIKEAARAQPFRPFALRMPDSRSLSVQHPDFVLVPPVGRTVFVYQADGSFNIVDTMLVTDLHFLPYASAQPESGVGSAD